MGLFKYEHTLITLSLLLNFVWSQRENACEHALGTDCGRENRPCGLETGWGRSGNDDWGWRHLVWGSSRTNTNEDKLFFVTWVLTMIYTECPQRAIDNETKKRKKNWWKAIYRPNCKWSSDHSQLFSTGLRGKPSKTSWKLSSKKFFWTVHLNMLQPRT